MGCQWAWPRCTPKHRTRGHWCTCTGSWHKLGHKRQGHNPPGHKCQMVAGKPKSYEAIADDWLHLLLAHRHEEPIESVARVKELLMKWHYICTPLSMH